MKIAIFSDLHLGFSFEDTNDAYENALSAFQLAIQEKADLILLAGDLFDKSIPNQETWLQAFEIFSLAKDVPSSLSFKIKDKEIKAKSLPIISISGTHEYRANLTNSLAILEKAGFLFRLHNQYAIFPELAIYGLTGIPEKFALPAIQKLSPQPIPNKYNIFVFHQSLHEFLPFDEHNLHIPDLPLFFNLYIDGHIHKPSFLPEQKLLITGSTILTQMKEHEQSSKKVFFLSLPEGKLEEKEIPNQRPFFYKKIKADSKSKQEIYSEISQFLSQILSTPKKKKPIIRIKISGKLQKGETTDFQFPKTEEAYLKIDTDTEENIFESSLTNLRNLQQEKTSIKEQAISLLENKLKETSFSSSLSIPFLFELLEKNPEEAEKYLLEKNQTYK